MFKKIGAFAARFPIPVILAFVGLSLFMASRLPQVEIDPSIKGLLPQDVEAQINLTQIEEIFGGSDMILVALETEDVINPVTIERVEAITEELEYLEGIDKVLSLANIKDISGDEWGLRVESFYDWLPETQEEVETIKDRLVKNEQYLGLVVSDDFTTTAVVGFLNEEASDEVLLEGLAQILRDNPGEERVYTGGLPVIRGEAAARMQRDMGRFLPMGLLIMLLFLFFSFRDLRGVILPFLVVILSIAFAMGTLVVLGWQIQLITIMLPVILIAIANDYGIHLMAQYQSRVCEHPGPWNREEKQGIIADLVGSLGGPVFWAGVTTILGFLSLATHLVTAAQKLGILAGLGITYALFGSLLFIPALLSLLPPQKHLVTGGSGKLRGQVFLEKLGGFIARYPRPIVGGTAVVLVVLAMGIPRLEADTNPLDFFPPSSQVYQADLFIQDKMGGSTTLNLVASGDVLEPVILKALDKMENQLAQREMLSKTSSLASVMKQINQVLNGGSSEAYTLPVTREGAAQYLLLYSMSGDPEDLERLVDFNYENALLTVKIKEASSKVIGEEVEYVESLLDRWEGHPFTMIGGFAVILRDLTNALVRGQIQSLFMALGVMVLLLSLVFRSLKTGFSTGIPLVISMVGLFGIMGWSGIALSTITTMLTSLLIGVGVDYTIHFLWEYRRGRSQGLTKEDSVAYSLGHSGRGIVINALSVVIGFVVLLFSGFLPIQFFGILITVSILFCLYGALVLLPALILGFSPGQKQPKE